MPRIENSLEKLEHTEVACLRVDAHTGTPIDIDGRWKIAAEEEYLVFDSLDDAQDFVRREARHKMGFEYVVVSSERELLWLFHSPPFKGPSDPPPTWIVGWFRKRLTGRVDWRIIDWLNSRPPGGKRDASRDLASQRNRAAPED